MQDNDFNLAEPEFRQEIDFQFLPDQIITLIFCSS